jgi:hypothetical protein
MTGLQRCRSCGAAIIWARTAKGKAIPVDRDATSRGNIVLSTQDHQVLAKVVAPGPGQRQAHFVTCPAAARWRKR